MDKKTNVPIYQTTNYAQFKRLKGNRDVKAVKKVKSSIQRNGYIFNPIIVNENMEVIDGQNRLGALESLGLPVHYYIVEGVGIELARELNLGRSNWKTLDYIKSYAEEGNLSYMMFLKLLADNESINYQELYGIVKNVIIVNGSSSTILQEGDFEMSDRDFEKAKESLEYLKELSQPLHSIDGAQRLVTSALAWCMRLEKVDVQRFIKVVNKNYVDFAPVNKNAETLLRDISKAYNSHLSVNKVIDFDVEYRKALRKGNA